MPRDTHLMALCHSLTLAPSTGLARGRQLLGPGQLLSPLPFSHINSVLSIVCDINGYHKWLFLELSPIELQLALVAIIRTTKGGGRIFPCLDFCSVNIWSTLFLILFSRNIEYTLELKLFLGMIFFENSYKISTCLLLLFLVSLCSTTRPHSVNSQQVSLPPVGILNSLCSI